MDDERFRGVDSSSPPAGETGAEFLQRLENMPSAVAGRDIMRQAGLVMDSVAREAHLPAREWPGLGNDGRPVRLPFRERRPALAAFFTLGGAGLGWAFGIWLGGRIGGVW